jgi:hypothetical protein
MKIFATLGVAMLAVMLAGCQSTGGFGGGPAIDGSWASDDGVFVARFSAGQFASTLTATGELATGDGRYTRSGSVVELSWISRATNERRLATCSFLTPGQLSCAPSVGTPFTLSRIA